MLTPKTLLRIRHRLPDGAKGNRQLTTLVRESGAIDMLPTEMQEQVKGCDAVISCLGHRDVFGHPRTLCFDTTRLVCDAIRALRPTNPIKYIVLNTALVDHPDGKTDPPRSFFERCLLWLLGALLPPHVDNVKTSHYLHDEIKTHDSHVEYCVVRPELLVNGDKGVGPPPAFRMSESLQNGIFGGATTTRGNVGRFMADLVTDSQAWSHWKGKFPQIFDVKDAKSK